jgi:hypothetical protein
MTFKIKAFPIYIKGTFDDVVECVEHPDTGKWWFRYRMKIRVPTRVDPSGHYYKWSPWECPENQPVEPYKGMRKLANRRYCYLPVALEATTMNSKMGEVATQTGGIWISNSQIAEYGILRVTLEQAKKAEEFAWEIFETLVPEERPSGFVQIRRDSGSSTGPFK